MASFTLTFWLHEITLFDTSLQRPVKHGIKLSFGGDVDLVVGLDVFLDGLATSVVYKVSPSHLKLECDRVGRSDNRAPIVDESSLPATISLFQLNDETRQQTIQPSVRSTFDALLLAKMATRMKEPGQSRSLTRAGANFIVLH